MNPRYDDDDDFSMPHDQKASDALIKAQTTGAHPRPSDSEGLGWGLGICMSNKFWGLLKRLALGSHFEYH